MKVKKASKNKLARELIYKTVVGILPVLVRFSASTGITDINQLSDYIQGLSVDEFCDYKFQEGSDQ